MKTKILLVTAVALFATQACKKAEITKSPPRPDLSGLAKKVAVPAVLKVTALNIPAIYQIDHIAEDSSGNLIVNVYYPPFDRSEFLFYDSQGNFKTSYTGVGYANYNDFSNDQYFNGFGSGSLDYPQPGTGLSDFWYQINNKQYWYQTSINYPRLFQDGTHHGYPMFVLHDANTTNEKLVFYNQFGGYGRSNPPYYQTPAIFSLALSQGMSSNAILDRVSGFNTYQLLDLNFTPVHISYSSKTFAGAYNNNSRVGPGLFVYSGVVPKSLGQTKYGMTCTFNTTIDSRNNYGQPEFFTSANTSLISSIVSGPAVTSFNFGGPSSNQIPIGYATTKNQSGSFLTLAPMDANGATIFSKPMGPYHIYNYYIYKSKVDGNITYFNDLVAVGVDKGANVFTIDSADNTIYRASFKLSSYKPYYGSDYSTSYYGINNLPLVNYGGSTKKAPNPQVSALPLNLPITNMTQIAVPFSNRPLASDRPIYVLSKTPGSGAGGTVYKISY